MSNECKVSAIEFPCGVRDTIYCLVDGEVFEFTVKSVTCTQRYEKRGMQCCGCTVTEGTVSAYGCSGGKFVEKLFSWDDFGVTVFTSPEAAGAEKGA